MHQAQMRHKSFTDSAQHTSPSTRSHWDWVRPTWAVRAKAAGKLLDTRMRAGSRGLAGMRLAVKCRGFEHWEGLYSPGELCELDCVRYTKLLQRLLED